MNMLDFLGKIRKSEQGIWKYADFYSEKIQKQNRLVLRDGNSRLEENEKINQAANIKHLYFKREDQNETGSLKGRSLAYQVSLNKQRGAKALAISTSGNAGIAAAAYAQKAGIKIFIFISPETEKAKVAHMQKYDPVIIKSRRAIRFANYVAAKYKIPNLRPSVDDDSIEGFKSIAFEIGDEAQDIDAVFTFVTSGSSFIGMYRGFEIYSRNGKIKNIPKMYAVQSGEIFSIAEEFSENKNLIAEKNCKTDSNIKAGQLGVKHTQRKREILDIIQKTSGKGIYASQEEIENAKKILEQNGIETSLEGCASFAGFMKIHKNEKFERAVCILSGKSRKEANQIDESKIYNAENFAEVDEIIKSISNR